MITVTQATQYIDMALGVSLPAFVVSAAVEKIETAEPAMVAAGYSEADMVLIQSMAVAVLACGWAPRRIDNQGASSGARRAFKYEDGSLSKLRRSLASLDTAGTVADLIGADPAMSTMFMVV